MNAFTKFKDSKVYDGPMPALTEEQQSDANWYKKHGWEIVKAVVSKVGDVVKITVKNKLGNKTTVEAPGDDSDLAMEGQDVAYFYAEWIHGVWMCFEPAPKQDW